MKISKIPGLGRFGIFVDDLKIDDLNNDRWLLLGEEHLKNLVTVIRNVDFRDVGEYKKWMKKWGDPLYLPMLALKKKYNIKKWTAYDYFKMNKEDKQYIEDVKRMVASADGKFNSVLRVTENRTHDNKPMGLFGRGDLEWHCNDGGLLYSIPGISLYGQKNMTNSSTGFMTTVDWYEEQPDSVRKELDETIVIHKYSSQQVNPDGEKYDDGVVSRNVFCDDNIASDLHNDDNLPEIPLVRKSLYGYKGIHLSSSCYQIVGLSVKESKKFFNYLRKSLFQEKYIYRHKYQTDNDLLIFDNTITLHNREGKTKDRLAFRIPNDYSKLRPEYNPYIQEPYKTDYERIKTNYANI
tara:strand:+ start:3940 stop:4992 length:1053 start_codon:yes stop_codon:yes gene_type:complete